MSMTSLFCKVDDFCISFLPLWEATLLEDKTTPKRHRKSQLTQSEVMTIVIAFHQKHFRNFKHFYCDFIQKYYTDKFPNLVSYQRFVELMKEVLIPLTAYLKLCCFGRCDGLSFVDSTPLKACHIKREHIHRTFNGIAKKGKTSTGWFYGFKVHLVIAHTGEILAVNVTAGNVDDRKPVLSLMESVFGMVYADKGYVSEQLRDILETQQVRFVAKPRKNMKKSELTEFDKVMLRHRAVIESVNDQLKNISQIEHTRHRCIENFCVNIVAGLIAYSEQDTKPSIDIEKVVPHLVTVTE